MLLLQIKSFSTTNFKKLSKAFTMFHNPATVYDQVVAHHQCGHLLDDDKFQLAIDTVEPQHLVY
jgi:hypothetical protein